MWRARGSLATWRQISASASGPVPVALGPAALTAAESQPLVQQLLASPFGGKGPKVLMAAEHKRASPSTVEE